MDTSKSVYELCRENENLRDFLISKGFDNLKNDMAFKSMAKLIKLKDALKLKNIDEEIFISEYESLKNIELEDEYTNTDGSLTVKGAVPCPIKIPLMDALKDFLNGQKTDLNFDLRSANLGMDFVTEGFKDGNELPDLITSAGFELILDSDIKRKIDEKYIAYATEISDEFKKRGADLLDPNGKFFILGVVPAVFIVNKNTLGNRSIPGSWEELISGEFKNSVSIPAMDLDMYNAVLITLYSKFGLDGIKRFKDSIFSNLHPAQMLKANNQGACVSIAPYFFASMIKNESLELVWPADGAIVSPIFMTVKKDSAEKLKPAIEYFLSDEVSEIFSFNGKFPSTNKKIDNMLMPDQKFMWTGWKLLNDDIERVKRDISSYFEI